MRRRKLSEKPSNVRSRKWRKKNRKQHVIQRRIQRSKVKEQVITHYGGGIARCVICGFSDIRALSIDHIEGGGTKERNKSGLLGNDFYLWLRKSWPKNYRTLCLNCQIIEYYENTKNVVIKGGPRERARYHHHLLKVKVLTHYGSGKLQCVLCEFSDVRSLCVDHINGGGKKHSKKVGHSRSFYAWIRRKKYPKGFRTLCMNCNFIEWIIRK